MKKNIWITGASTGIGKALAIKFAKEGWRVAASARRENLLKELENNNSNIKSFPLDVLDENKTKITFQNIIKEFKELEVCVFSTGIHDPEAEKDFNIETVRKIMDTNFFGTLNSIMSVNKYFREKKSGHISIVSSVAGYRGLPDAAGYCSSKAALISLAETLYFDFKRFNITISLINPGFIKTPMTDENKFNMPMLKTAEYAADKIFKGITKDNVFEIHFPKSFTFLMKILRIMPNWLFFYLMNIAVKVFKRRST